MVIQASAIDLFGTLVQVRYNPAIDPFPTVAVSLASAFSSDSRTGMNIDLAQAITILANVGVIAGIAFLGFEMRQNTTAIRSTAAQQLHNQIQATYDTLIDESTMEIYVRGMENPSSLNQIERARFYALLTSHLQSLQNAYFQVRVGTYEEQFMGGWWQLLRNMFDMPGFQEHWRARGFILSQEFQDFIETEVMALKPTTEVLGNV